MENVEHDLKTDILELIEKEKIKDVLHRYCRAVDRGDLEMLRSCYHPDAHDDHGFFSGSGWDFADYVIPRLAQLQLSIHSLTNILIEVKGDKAFVESQWSVVHRIKRILKMTDMWHQGRYLDIFEKREGVWKISRRLSVVDADRWLDGVDLNSIAPKDSPHSPQYGIRGKEDLVYKKFELQNLPKRRVKPMDNLWLPFRILLLLPKVLLRLLGKQNVSRRF